MGGGGVNIKKEKLFNPGNNWGGGKRDHVKTLRSDDKVYLVENIVGFLVPPDYPRGTIPLIPPPIPSHREKEQPKNVRKKKEKREDGTSVQHFRHNTTAYMYYLYI